MTLALYLRHPIVFTIPPTFHFVIYHLIPSPSYTNFIFTTIPPTFHFTLFPLNYTTNIPIYTPGTYDHTWYIIPPTFGFPMDILLNRRHPLLPFNNIFLLLMSCYTLQIGPRGAIQLGDALRQNKSLTEIDLRENSLGPAGMKAIADALAENDSMRSLHLQVCQRRYRNRGSSWSGRVRPGRIGSGPVGSGRVRKRFKYRGSGRVRRFSKSNGSGRVTRTRPDPTRPDPRSSTRLVNSPAYMVMYITRLEVTAPNSFGG